jgi:hypothetical protein
MSIRATIPCLLLAAGCSISVPPSELHPSVRNAPATSEDSNEARRDLARKTAAADLACDHVEIVLTFDRRYANGTTIRYAIEGCGRRALYAESCEAYPECRYLQVGVSPIAPAAPR